MEGSAVVCKSQYCPYSHFSSMLERTGDDWLLAMIDIGDFEVYFDDSGTHAQSEIAIGSCYIARKNQWDWFVKNLNEAREKEGFDVFHMADFMGGQGEFSGWDQKKRERVLRWISCIIKTRATIGISCGVPRNAWDDHMPDKYKSEVGKRHYTYAVRCVLGIIHQWRKKYGYSQPMQYVFDWMTQGKGEIMAVMDVAKEFPQESLERYGMAKDGYSFQHKEVFKPLQAADMLAWETYNHMRTVVLPNSSSDGTSNFQYLRRHPSPVFTGWWTDDQIKKMASQLQEYETQTGKSAFWNSETGTEPVQGWITDKLDIFP